MGEIAILMVCGFAPLTWWWILHMYREAPQDASASTRQETGESGRASAHLFHWGTLINLHLRKNFTMLLGGVAVMGSGPRRPSEWGKRPVFLLGLRKPTTERKQHEEPPMRHLVFAPSRLQFPMRAHDSGDAQRRGGEGAELC
jgi:hypothetical protein